MFLKFERKSRYFFFILKSKSFQFFCKATAVINYDVPEENEHYTHRIGRTGRARKQGASYLFYTKEEQKRVDQLLRLTRNTDDCKSVKFDFNHEHLKIEDTAPADKFQIKAYF